MHLENLISEGLAEIVVLEGDNTVQNDLNWNCLKEQS